MSKSIIVMWIEPRFLDDRAHAVLTSSTSKYRLLITEDIDDVLRHASEVDVVLGDFPRQYLSKLPNLKWFQQFGTGVEWLQTHPELIDSRFVLTNCSDGHFDVVADHLMALLLSQTRSIPAFARHQQNRHWQPTSLTDCDTLFTLKDKKVLLVGVGSVGCAIAKRLNAFGARVTGMRREASAPQEYIEAIYPLSALTDRVKDANIVISCLPKTAATDGLFDAQIFKNMRKPAFFFNIGRGNAVDEQALVRALENADLNGAAIDVAQHEPITADSPLWSAPNLLITPHVGGTYNEVTQAWCDVAIDNLQRYLAQQPLRNKVDKKRGY